MATTWGKRLIGSAAAALVIAVAAPNAAQAGHHLVEGPFFTNSFGFADGLFGATAIDLVAVRVLGTEGGPLETDSFRVSTGGSGGGLMAAGWARTVDDGLIAAASGPALSVGGSDAVWANFFFFDPKHTVTWDTVWFETSDATKASHRFRTEALYNPNTDKFTISFFSSIWDPDRGSLTGIPLPASAGLAAFGMIGLLGIGLVRRRFAA